MFEFKSSIMNCRRSHIPILVVALVIQASACDGGAPSRTTDEFAADSALAADLALANRDTLLVDSIGAYREAGAAERSETARAEASNSDLTREVRPEPAASAPAPATLPQATPAQPAATRAAPAASPALTGLRACNSPTLENQSECIRVSLAAADSRLNRIYRALITEMRRQEQVAPAAKDPPSVQRLRVAQRAWLVYRDTECRRRGRGKEGSLWAKPRAKCLGEFSVRRATELADNFSRLTAH